MFVLLSIGVTLAATSVPAAAQYYAGASAGATTVDLCDDLSGLGVTGCDDDDTGLKLFAGSRINQNFAAELGWVDLGELKATGPGGSARVGVDGVQLAALGIAPLNPNWQAFGKLGLYLWDTSASAGIPEDDGSDVMFGLGAAWKVARPFDVRFEWERFDVDGSDVDLFSAGVQFNF